MPDQTVDDLRARVRAVTSPDTLPPDHPIWGLLDWLGQSSMPADIEPEVRLVMRNQPTPRGRLVLNTPQAAIWWLLEDLVTAAELSAQAHVKIVAQQIELEAWRNSASILSQMLAAMTRVGRVTLEGDEGEARRKAIEFVARRSSRDDVLGVQPKDRMALRPWEHKRGLRASSGDGWHDVEETAPL